MGLAMNQHLQGKSVYKRFREECIFVLPGETNLQQKVIKQNVREADNVELYERILLHMTTRNIMGQIMCDEMKLKGEIAMCVNTNSLKGFTRDFVDSKKY